MPKKIDTKDGNLYCILNKASLIWGLPCGIVHVVVHWHLRACLEEVVSRVMYDRVRNRKNYFKIAAILNFKQGSSRVGNSNENKNTRKDISVGKKYNITLNFPHFWYSWIQFTKREKISKSFFLFRTLSYVTQVVSCKRSGRNCYYFRYFHVHSNLWTALWRAILRRGGCFKFISEEESCRVIYDRIWEQEKSFWNHFSLFLSIESRNIKSGKNLN